MASERKRLAEERRVFAYASAPTYRGMFNFRLPFCCALHLCVLENVMVVLCRVLVVCCSFYCVLRDACCACLLFYMLWRYLGFSPNFLFLFFDPKSYLVSTCVQETVMPLIPLHVFHQISLSLSLSLCLLRILLQPIWDITLVYFFFSDLKNERKS